MPPTMRRTLSWAVCASGVSVSLTCMASSRVGTRTRPSGRLTSALRPLRRVSIARPNARVLPEPVCPRPRMSRPAMASGSVATWMGKGDSMPARCRAGTRGWETPSSAKVGTADMSDESIRDDWRVSNVRSGFDHEQDSRAALSRLMRCRYGVAMTQGYGLVTAFTKSPRGPAALPLR